MKTNRAHKQKYQNNTQLFPGTSGIPFPFLFHLSTIEQAGKLDPIPETDWSCFYRKRPMEDLDHGGAYARELGAGSQEMAIRE